MTVYILLSWNDRSDTVIGVYSSLQSAVAATPQNRRSRWLNDDASPWDGVSDVKSLAYEGASSWSGYSIERHEVQS